MARRLGDDPNLMLFQDNISNSEPGLYFRMPTPKERIDYTNESFRRQGKKIENRAVETRMKYGMKILIGLRDGDFERKVGEKWQQISSDPDSSDYFESWRDHVKKYASDLVEHMAIRVFEVPVQVPEDQRSGVGDQESENENGAEEDPEKN